MKKLKLTFITSLFILLFTWSAASAQVTGNAYTLTVFGGQDWGMNSIVFNPTGILTIPAITGSGVYLDITPLFFGVYWAPDAQIGGLWADAIIIFTGTSVLPNNMVGIGYVVSAYPSHSNYTSVPFSFYGQY